MATKEQKKQLALWREVLYSGDAKAIEEALKILRDKGSTDILPDIINIYKAYKGTNLGNKIFTFLCDIKHSDATDLIIRMIADQEYFSIKQDLISLAWQTRLDFSPYIENFVDIFINDQINFAFEAFTAIEYMEMKHSKEKLPALIEKLQMSVSDISDDKKELLVDLVNILRKKNVPDLNFDEIN